MQVGWDQELTLWLICDLFADGKLPIAEVKVNQGASSFPDDS